MPPSLGTRRLSPPRSSPAGWKGELRKESDRVLKPHATGFSLRPLSAKFLLESGRRTILSGFHRQMDILGEDLGEWRGPALDCGASLPTGGRRDGE